MRYRLKRTVITLMIISCVLCIFPRIAYADYSDSQREKVKVGFFSMDGYHMMDEEGNRSGYGWDVLRLMARYWDVDYEYIGYENSWEEMQQMLDDGEIDMISSARKVSEREEKFDFSRAIGKSEGILTVRKENKRIVSQDYSTYNGMKVALLNGSTRNEGFHEFSEKKGFTYEPVYFDMTSDMEDALQLGKVDAIVTSSLRQLGNERVIERFDDSEFYIMVRKGNKELLNQINYAIDQLNDAEGDWMTELQNKYYDHLDNKILNFTEEEKAVIQEYSSKEDPLLVLCDPTRYPYSYNEDGEMKGIIPDYFRSIAQYIGISYKFVNCKTRNEYMEYMLDPSIDLCIDGRVSDENQVELVKYGISATYLTMRIAMVNRRDFDGEINTVATVDQTLAGNIEDIYAKNAEKIVYEDREKAMEAVLDGKADAAFVYYYSAQAYVNKDQTGILTYSLLEDTSYQYHMLVSSKVNHQLAGILTKAIYAMPEKYIEDLAHQYTAHKASDITLFSMMQLHPGISLTIIILLVSTFVGGGILIVKMRAQKQMQEVAQEKAEEMAILAKEAQRANQAKNIFLSHMSHDMRTPMNAIMGFTNMALGSKPTNEIQNYLEKIKESSSYLLSLINDVLDFAKIESGKDIYRPEPTDLREVTDTVLNIVNDSMKNRNLIFEVRREPREVPIVLADAIHIRDILVNILSNAIKYTEDGGQITFSMKYCFAEDEKHITACYQISDTGIGMSEEFLPYAFDEFAQDNSDVRTKYSGSGLGLAIVKRYVTMMGGIVSLESKLGEGTTFTVEIPLEITSEKHTKEDSSITDLTNLHGMKVLLAEDNDLNAEIMIAMLENAGMIVTRAMHGREAVAMYTQHPAHTYDVILMDIMMPEMNGYEATREIRSMEERPDGKTIPIIAITANAFAEDVEKSMITGMNGHISKPISVDGMMRLLVKIHRG